MKARGRAALATEVQRRAVESHEAETTERWFLCVPKKRAENSSHCLVGARTSWGAPASNGTGASQTLRARQSDKKGESGKRQGFGHGEPSRKEEEVFLF